VPDWRAIVAIVVIVVLAMACGPTGTAHLLHAVGAWISTFFGALVS
jgi:hypothetical protein